VHVHVGQAGRKEGGAMSIDHVRVGWHGQVPGDRPDGAAFDQYRLVAQNPLAVHRHDIDVFKQGDATVRAGKRVCHAGPRNADAECGGGGQQERSPAREGEVAQADGARKAPHPGTETQAGPRGNDHWVHRTFFS